MKIRIEKESDVNQITEIHNQAFTGPDEGKIVENLRKNKNLTLSLVCEINGKLTGHIAYSPIRKQEEIIGVGLAPVAVLPSMQNQGIGSQLIKYGNAQAFEMGFKRIFVLGGPEYYSRFGFTLAKEYNYYCDYDPEGNHFMVQGELSKETEKTIAYYCKEFNV
jgi:putative acetyltransferase